MINYSELFNKDLILIEDALLKEKTYDRHCACSILVNNYIKNYKNDSIEKEDFEKLEKILRKSRSDIWMYRVLSILDFKKLDFSNLYGLAEICINKEFYKSLNFLRFKDNNFYKTMKALAPKVILENIFIEDETLNCLYNQFDKYGMNNLMEKLKELKEYVKTTALTNFDDLDYDLFYDLIKTDESFDTLIFIYINNLKEFIKFFQQSFPTDWLVYRFKIYLEDYGYTKDITFNQLEPNDVCLNIIDIFKLLRSKKLIKGSKYIYMDNRISFISKRNRIENKIHTMVMNEDYIQLRKEIDKDINICDNLSEYIELIFSNIKDKKGLLFLKFLLNRNLIDGQIIRKNYMKIKYEDIRGELIQHLNKIKDTSMINIDCMKLNSNNNLNKYYVYFFYEDEILYYVGKTHSLKLRFIEHKNNTTLTKEIINAINMVKYIEFNTENEACMYEIYYIDTLHPKYNIEYNKSKGLSFTLPKKEQHIYKEW